MATPQPWSSVGGIGYDDADANPAQPGLTAGRKLNSLAQTTNKVTSTVANQDCGAALLSSSGGTVVAGTTVTVAVTNSLATALSMIWPAAVNNTTSGTFATDATAGRGMDVWIESTAAGFFVIGFRPTANMASDWSCWYWIRN